jgi:hypothetical protein
MPLLKFDKFSTIVYYMFLTLLASSRNYRDPLKGVSYHNTQISCINYADEHLNLRNTYHYHHHHKLMQLQLENGCIVAFSGKLENNMFSLSYLTTNYCIILSLSLWSATPEQLLLTNRISALESSPTNPIEPTTITLNIRRNWVIKQ